MTFQQEIYAPGFKIFSWLSCGGVAETFGSKLLGNLQCSDRSIEPQMKMDILIFPPAYILFIGG